MSLIDDLIVHLLAPVCGGVGGLALAWLLLDIADHLARKYHRRDS